MNFGNILVGIAAFFVTLCLLVVIQPVSSDVLTGQVSVGNSAPSVSSVNLYDSDLSTIQLTAGGDTNMVYCDGTVTDANGYGDVRNAWATIFNGTGVPVGSDTPNFRYTNNSCNLTRGAGTTVYVNCSFLMQHEAMNGTWTCNISVNDSQNFNGSTIGTNTIDAQTGISVLETLINFQSMSLGQMSGTNQTTNVTDQGNVVLDIKVNGSNYTCTQIGLVPVNNTRYSVSAGNYSNMANNLPADSSQATETSFDLGVEGIATATNVPSWKYEYWNIIIPGSGVAGTCTNQIQITGTYGGA